MTKTKVVNIYYHVSKGLNDVYIGRGRGSIWGNPYSHKDGTLAEFKVDTREEAVEMYGKYIYEHPNLLSRLKDELKGKNLVCFCRPVGGFQGKLMCHGQILASIAEDVSPEEIE